MTKLKSLVEWLEAVLVGQGGPLVPPPKYPHPHTINQALANLYKSDWPKSQRVRK